MAALSTVMAPMITYGYNTDNSVTGSIRCNTAVWTDTTTNTYPTWWDNSPTASTIEVDYIQYHTFDDFGYTQYTQQPGYRVKILRANGNAATNYYIDDRCTWQTYHSPPVKTAAERLKEILNGRMAPNIITRKPIANTMDVREMRARETLRRVLGEDKYRDFVRRGSVSVMAKSGLVYQIFPGHDFTKVYNRGMLVDRLCVVLQGGFPPTDSLIMRYLMILNNEQQFRSFAIKHGVTTPVTPDQPDQRSLVEIFKELKKVA